MAAKRKSSRHISMPYCRPFLPSDLSAIPKHKPMDGWTDEWMHEKTIPTGIDVSWGHVILIHQYAKCYAIPSKWFVNKWAETWKCDERMDRQTEGQTSGWGVILCPPSTCYRTEMLSKINIQKCKKNHFLWRCDVNLWPMTLKSLSFQGTIANNVYAKFENNPSNDFWVITLTPLRRAALTLNYNIPWSFPLDTRDITK